MAQNNPFDKVEQFVVHYPFVLLIDTSYSTSSGANPDIHQINTSLNEVIKILKNPPVNSELRNHAESVDICVIQYNDVADVVVPWTNITGLPNTIDPLVPKGNTHTGDALMYCFAKINEQYEFYKNKGFESGRCYIFHLTDGGITDMKPGDPKWEGLSKKIYRLGGGGGQSNVKVPILTFLSANGMRGSGVDLIKPLMGDESLYDMGDRIKNFPALVEFIASTIGLISSGLSRTPEDVIKEIRPKLENDPGVIPLTEHKPQP